jgi:hypothetical protein
LGKFALPIKTTTIKPQCKLQPINFDLESGPTGQAYKLLVGLVAPRPIALITSMNKDGRLNIPPFIARRS